MADVPVVGKNSYAAEVDANEYLDDSIRAGSWALRPAATRYKALVTAFRLIEKQCLLGDATGLEVVDTVAVNVGGTGYTTNDILIVVGGTGSPARAKVTATAGVVTALQLIDTGAYSVNPGATAIATTSSSAGTGCTVNLTFGAQTLHFPATGLTDHQGVALADDAIPLAVIYANIELAYELTRNASLETSGGQGNDKKSVQAGSARVEWFRPTGGPNGTGSFRFPTIVQELIGRFLCGSRGGGVPFLGGDEEKSHFTDCADYGFGEPLK